VAIIGAGARGEFRDEDQLCCAWIAQLLFEAGYAAENQQTRAIVSRWDGVPVETISAGASADYLRRTGQLKDLDFILGHVDDLDETMVMERNQVVKRTLRVASALLPVG
jgi:2-phosphosulfolactate phosphatase